MQNHLNRDTMIEEIRIYFESYEQAHHFIQPYIENILTNLKVKIPIKLDTLKKTYQLYSKRLFPILFWKNPYILIHILIKK